MESRQSVESSSTKGCISLRDTYKNYVPKKNKIVKSMLEQIVI